MRIGLWASLACVVAGGPTLAQVSKEGVLRCGTRTNSTIFGWKKADGDVAGLDADICKAVAAAVLGPKYKVDFKDAENAATRFDLLRAGNFDLLCRNTAQSIGRDVNLGLTFGSINFYDGQAFMVNKQKGPAPTLDSLKSSTYCVVEGTTTQANTLQLFPKATPVLCKDYAELAKKLKAGECKSATAGKATLQELATPNNVILPDIVARDATSCVTREEDQEWSSIVAWVVAGLKLAEAEKITQANVLDKKKSKTISPEAGRLLTADSDEIGIPLRDDFMVQALLAVGNYGEIYARNVEAHIPRNGTENALWLDGGLHYPEAWNMQHGTTNQMSARTRGATLAATKKAGKLSCCTSQENALFGMLDKKTNNVVGFDADYCRAVAAAIFTPSSSSSSSSSSFDVEKYIKWVDASSSTERFNLLHSGQCDILIRSTTNTVGRDIGGLMTFARPNFFDGQGFMVHSSSGIKSLAQLDVMGNTYCVQATTTSEQNAKAQMKQAVAVLTKDPAEQQRVFEAGNCTAVTDDKSSLAGVAQPNKHRLLAATISREPLAAVTRDGDTAWSELVAWVTDGLVLAESLGITKAKARTMDLKTLEVEGAALLGQGIELTGWSGISPDFMKNVVAVVGNYGEIYQRHLEAAIPRDGTQNELWKNHGLQYPGLWAGATATANTMTMGAGKTPAKGKTAKAGKAKAAKAGKTTKAASGKQGKS